MQISLLIEIQGQHLLTTQILSFPHTKKELLSVLDKMQIFAINFHNTCHHRIHSTHTILLPKNNAFLRLKNWAHHSSLVKNNSAPTKIPLRKWLPRADFYIKYWPKQFASPQAPHSHAERIQKQAANWTHKDARR